MSLKPSASRLPCGRPVPPKASTQTEALSKSSWKERLDRYLRQKNLKQSASRLQIIERILSQTGHFTVPELVRKVQDAQPGIGAATVYRNIPLLCEIGILRETLTDESGQKIYEIGEEGHHDHIVCLDCREIFEFHDDAIEVAQERVASKMRFLPAHHRHVLYAHCGYKR